MHPGDVRKAAAILFLSDPVDIARSAGSRLAELYGLTTSEAQIAQAIAEGLDLKSVASERSASLHTVKTQVRSIMAKIGAARQSDIVRAVLATAVLA